MKVKTRIETSSSSTHPSTIVTQVFPKSFELDRCALNLIAYGVLQSTSLSIAEQTSYDKNSVQNILLPHDDTFPSSFKLIRIGKP